jgi:hypothetical protein
MADLELTPADYPPWLNPANAGDLPSWLLRGHCEWVERVKTFGGIREVGRAALRGTDGTNAQLFSEEIMEQVENLDEETRARIDELMDPDR